MALRLAPFPQEGDDKDQVAHYNDKADEEAMGDKAVYKKYEGRVRAECMRERAAAGSVFDRAKKG